MNGIIYYNTIDNGAFTVIVKRKAERLGTLIVTETASGEQILSKLVSVAFGGPFGPDVYDVTYWQHEAIEAIDKWLAENHE